MAGGNVGELALMFGNLEGRVAKCLSVPASMNITRGGKRLTKVCFPKTSKTSKHLVKVGKRTTINVAHLHRLGKGAGNASRLTEYVKEHGRPDSKPKASLTQEIAVKGERYVAKSKRGPKKAKKSRKGKKG